MFRSSICPKHIKGGISSFYNSHFTIIFARFIKYSELSFEHLSSVKGES